MSFDRLSKHFPDKVRDVIEYTIIRIGDDQFVDAGLLDVGDNCAEQLSRDEFRYGGISYPLQWLGQSESYPVLERHFPQEG